MINDESEAARNPPLDIASRRYYSGFEISEKLAMVNADNTGEIAESAFGPHQIEVTGGPARTRKSSD